MVRQQFVAQARTTLVSPAEMSATDGVRHLVELAKNTKGSLARLSEMMAERVR